MSDKPLVQEALVGQFSEMFIVLLNAVFFLKGG
jgi:hypothetical protein